jgi:hypothetical protein
MILFVCVSLKEIVKRGRDFSWPKPECCPRCGGNRLWGHGFVEALFDGCPGWVWLRRYRCPECRCVLRLRPAGYFKRFQASSDAIRARIVHRLELGTWLGDMSRSRQGYWLSNLKRRVCARLGHGWSERLVEAFDRFLRKGEVPVGRLT